MINILNGDLAERIENRDFQEIVKHLINKSNSILDIGCGIGNYLKYTNPRQKVTAIEPHAPYIEKAKEAAPWAEIKNTDGLSYFSAADEKFDLILLIDVVEHLEEDDGLRLISEAIKHCSGIVFAQIPIGNHEQTEDEWNMGGEYWQTHRTTWDKKKLSKTEFNFIQIWKDWYEWEENNFKSRDTSIAIYFNEPMVSVVVPSYNQAQWLPKTLDSILEQTYPFWETVVVDDGSTDDTWRVIEEYIKKDKRIRGIRKENGGISSALNTGIQNAKGDYFCWLSSDDLFYRNKLELQIKAYEQLDNSYGLVFGQFDFVDPNEKVTVTEQSKPFEDGLEFPQQLKYDIVDGCTVMIPMKIMRQLKGFNPQYKHAQDTEFWFRLAAKGYKFYYIDQKLVKRRIHEEQGFTDFSLDCRYDGYDIVNFYLDHYSFTDFYKNIDWNSEDDLLKFLNHFFDMLDDTECHINHPVINDKFWKWFLIGLRSLPSNVREIILKNGVAFFSLKENDFYKLYLDKFREELNNISSISSPIIKAKNDSPDLLKYDRSKSEYATRLYRFGIKSEERWDHNIAISVFKYLADYPNPYNEKSFQKFTDLCFIFQEFRIFVKSFKRKKSILRFDDRTKLLYIWAKISIGENDNIDEIISSISDSGKKEIAKKFIAKNFPETSVDNIIIWNYSVRRDKIEHFLRVKCDNCGSILNKRIKFNLSSEASQKAYVCTNCYSSYLISDAQMKEHFNRRSHPLSNLTPINGRSPKIAFIMRYTDIIGGGLKVAYKHMEMLSALGCEITIYSDSSYPGWTKLPGNFIQLNDHYEIEELEADIAVVFSVYDVPKIMTKFSTNRIFHLCQGYEGYHLGKDFKQLRSDKYFYDTLHSFPVNNIVVSKHLYNLFEEKFGRKAHYIPNSIDFNTFYPNPEIDKEPNSILFIGNPFDTLKGFQFLIETLTVLLEKNYSIGKIHLYVLWGGQNYSEEIKNLNYPDLWVEFVTGLSSNEVARLLNKASLLVSCSMYEGFALPVLEAMACGVPTITTDNMGTESFCVDGVNSFVVEYGDTKTFAERIIDVLKERIDIQSLIENGFETALEYSTYKATNILFDEYSKILKYNFPPELKEKMISKVEINQEELKSRLKARLESINSNKNLKPSSPIHKSAGNNYLEQTLYHLENNELDLAMATVEKALSSFDSANSSMSYEELLKIARNIALAKGDMEKAEELSPKAEQRDHFHTNSGTEYQISNRLLTAEVLIEDEKLDAAENLLKEILIDEPQNLDAINNMAVVNILNGQYENALERLENIINIDPNNETAISNLNYLNALLTSEERN